jgi:hypothetical protein
LQEVEVVGKWLLALWIMTIVGLGAVYSNMVDLQETIKTQNLVILKLNQTIIKKDERNNALYKDQIERWTVPYEFKIPGDPKKPNCDLIQKGARG